MSRVSESRILGLESLWVNFAEFYELFEIRVTFGKFEIRIMVICAKNMAFLTKFGTITTFIGSIF